MTKSGGIMDRRPNNVNKFWLSYRGAVIASGIPEKTAEWYVHRAQKFAVSIKGKALRSRSSKDVHSFLNQLERQDNIEQWQVKQAEKALIFLYRDFLQLDINKQGEESEKPVPRGRRVGRRP